MAEPITVLITGAAGQIGYALAPQIARGAMFGPEQKVVLHLLDIPPAQTALEGVVMELIDCAYPLLAGMWLLQTCLMVTLTLTRSLSSSDGPKDRYVTQLLP